ncbi:hypothetical protein [Candidatus Phytoplasma sp. AldY-WA1]|uniref:hypothetical protein n=1 Tax=Candidatus Phytoplasma sp. AldY-WA1 TaxID=2852100 RepID=UPI00254BF350|nr:hypothetical protein [Candidatus Phytoplasma sp. AldY-WA1]
MNEIDKSILEILKKKNLKTNKCKPNILEIESCYFKLFFDIFKELDIFLLENKKINTYKIEKEIDDLIKKIKNLFIYEIVHYKFPFPLEKEDLLLINYQFLVKKNKKIQLEI